MNRQKGFTLIELLVVIAIIGILSSVVLVSLNDARLRGANAAVKSNLSNIRAQAEIYYSNYNQYSASTITNACPSSGAITTSLFRDPVILSALDAARNSGGTASLVRCWATSGVGGTWAISVPLRQSEGINANHWCVDSRGASKPTASQLTTHQCP